jgi:phosphoribosylformylglycinamidine cyclo-ligase
MPGFYPPGRYDLAGFCVGVVEEEEIVDGRLVQAGDGLLALASSGAHSNGFSLIRRILETSGANAETVLAAEGRSVLDALLAPTRLYGGVVSKLRGEGIPLRAMAHITGGGLPENLPRCLPAHLHARIDPTSWERPELFRWLQSEGDVPEADLWNTFNLGVGFCLVVAAEDVSRTVAICERAGHLAWPLGSVEAGPAGVEALEGLPY